MSKFDKLIRYFKEPDYRYKINLKLCGYHKNMDDKKYLERVYAAVMGDKLDLENPKTFNEKLQWLKLYDRKPEYTKMVDKYEAKKYVAGIIGEECIIPTLGVWDSFDEIDFDTLPDKFVLKCTHDSDGLVICRDKRKLNLKKAERKISTSLKNNFYYRYREWPYKDVKPRIIAEQYMEDENAAEGLTDYKFFCFNGMPQYLYISQGLGSHSTAAISFYDMEGNKMPFRRSDYNPIKGDIVLPDNFEQMRKTAQILAESTGCAFARIDLYSIRGMMYFSEITFFPCSGLMPFEPKEWDAKFGEHLMLQIDK